MYFSPDGDNSKCKFTSEWEKSFNPDALM